MRGIEFVYLLIKLCIGNSSSKLSMTIIYMHSNFIWGISYIHKQISLTQVFGKTDNFAGQWTDIAPGYKTISLLSSWNCEDKSSSVTNWLKHPQLARQEVIKQGRFLRNAIGPPQNRFTQWVYGYGNHFTTIIFQSDTKSGRTKPKLKKKKCRKLKWYVLCLWNEFSQLI